MWWEDPSICLSSDEGHGSDFSSRTTGKDFELDHFTAEDPFSDDAETGITKKDKNIRIEGGGRPQGWTRGLLVISRRRSRTKILQGNV